MFFDRHAGRPAESATSHPQTKRYRLVATIVQKICFVCPADDKSLEATMTGTNPLQEGIVNLLGRTPMVDEVDYP